MRIDVFQRGSDIATAFGSAGSGCILPPEIDYREHTLEIFVVYENGDTFTELSGELDALLYEALDDAGYGRRDHDIELDERNFDVLSAPMLRDLSDYRDDTNVRGALRFHATAAETTPCGGAGGVYERIGSGYSGFRDEGR